MKAFQSRGQEAIQSMGGWLLAIAFVLGVGCAGGSSQDGGTDLDGDTNTEQTGPDTDGAGDRGPGPDACGFEDIPYEWQAEIIQVLSEDEQTCVKMVRKPKPGPGCAGISVNYELLSLTVGHGEETVVITDGASLIYHCTLHNWYDRAEGRQAGVVYLFQMQVDTQDWNTIRYQVQAQEESSSTVLWGPVELFPYQVL